MSRNDVRAEVDAHVARATVTTTNAGNVAITATESAQIMALDDSVVSGGEATAGIVVTNIVLAQALAFIEDGATVTAAGNVTVAASNAAVLDATASSVVEGKKQTVGFILAFNTVGWKAQNVLFNTVDALIGSPEIADAFGNEQAARAEAYIIDSVVIATGSIAVTADNLAQINATAGSESSQRANSDFALFAALDGKAGASGMAAGAILASNKVSSRAQAYIKDTDSADAVSTRVDGDTGVRVEANDNAGIDANSEVTVASVSTNTVDALKGLAGNLGLDDYQYTSKSGERTLNDGDRVRLASDYANGRSGRRGLPIHRRSGRWRSTDY